MNSLAWLIWIAGRLNHGPVPSELPGFGHRQCQFGSGRPGTRLAQEAVDRHAAHAVALQGVATAPWPVAACSAPSLAQAGPWGSPSLTSTYA